MNIRFYLYQARRWFFLALVPALLVGVLTYEYVQHKPKTYQALAKLYVQQANNSGTGVAGGIDITGSQQLAPTYVEMMTDPVILHSADQILDKKYPGYAVEQHLVTAAQGASSTTLIFVTVTDTVPRRAADAANAIAAAFIKRVTQIELSRFASDERSLDRQVAAAQSGIKTVTQQINNYSGSSSGLDSLRSTLAAYTSTYQNLLVSLEQFKATRDSTVNSVTVYSPATVPTSPSGPHPARETILVAVLALLLCGGAVYIYDYLDDSVRRPEEIEEIIGAPVLGTVEHFDSRRAGTQLVTVAQPRSPTAEAYRVIRTGLQFAAVGGSLRAIMITSAVPEEGKSTTVSNLAEVFAEGGRTVTLVDGDLRRPSLHRIFSIDRKFTGLTNMLLSDHLNGHVGQQANEIENLSVVASGPMPPNPADLLSSQRMHDVLRHLQEHADLVLIDTPPILAVADASILAGMVDGVVIVVDPSKSKRRELRKARESIEGVGGKILGVVVNQLSPSRSGFYYYYSYGQTGYFYGHGAAANRSSVREKSSAVEPKEPAAH